MFPYKLKIFLFYLAAFGWVMAIIMHLSALIFNYDLRRVISFSLFFLFIPLVIVAIPAFAELKLQWHEKTFGKQAPTWLIGFVIFSFAYAFVNFILFGMSQPGSPEVTDIGNFFLKEGTRGGKFIRKITEKEYFYYRANEIRGMTGHIIAVFSLALMAFYPAPHSSNRTSE